ncbi:MAG: acyl--CoA ligase, partial [Clostridia bacterium]|nr:acyl--CoA ligase [Clostridia bacterium]
MNSKTGFPSIDKPWLKYYREGAEERTNDIPKDKTVWDVIEEKLIEYKDIPAIEYFGRKISRPEFIDMVYTWAKAFRAMGIKEDEIVVYYGPFFPDVGAMALALNMIGACPYFLKLAISPEALAEETKECRIAIVFEDMWQNVSGEFTKDRFEKVIIINASDDMSAPKKQVVSILAKLKRKNTLPKEKKYYSIKKAKSFAKYYSGELKTPFVPDRPAFITSSSGTTVGGIVKSCVATNEATISQLVIENETSTQFHSGDRCLNNLPPTASSSLNVLFMLSLYTGETVVFDPRVSDNDFYKQILKLKPNLILTTGSFWETFFNRVTKEIDAGARFDFSYARAWVVGGEGSDIKKIRKWNDAMSISHARNLLLSGYGSSELFSAITCERVNARYDYSKPIMSVGIPSAGFIIGIFDIFGNELSYNVRGELWVKSKTAMKCYYNKPELTEKIKIDGWIHTGDLAEIDENGFVYIWGRLTDKVDLDNGKSVYLFDIANEIK